MIKINSLLVETRKLYEAIYRFDVEAAARLGLHITDLRCVNALENAPLSAGEIAKRLALSSGSVTALVDRLVDAGFAERVADSSDRRRSFIVLTADFRVIADQVYAELGESIAEAFEAFPDESMDDAVRSIAMLRRGFASAYKLSEGRMSSKNPRP